LENLKPETKALMEKAVADFTKLGAEIKEIELPNARYSLPVYYIIMPSEVSSNLARFDGIKYGMRADDYADTPVDINSTDRKLLETYLDSRRYGFGPEVKRRIMLGTYALSAGYYDAYYKRAQQVRTLIKKDFENAFDLSAGGVDLILTPTSPTPAFKLGEKTEDPLEMYLSDIFTVTANIAGAPAISVPAGGIGKGGLPFGLQLTARWFDEENLLRAAHAYEISSK
jgi:aspartyl-tRNA(Asn)/glutamyl-tRNA(Gln) amidotransferase subunit A